MPIDDIVFNSPIKRKAISVMNTQCRFCHHTWADKWYKGESVHKVICPKCKQLNAAVDIDDWHEIMLKGIRHDIGTAGGMGGFSVGLSKLKKYVMKAYNCTEEEAEQKLKELAYSIRIKEKQKKVEEERKKNQNLSRI